MVARGLEGRYFHLAMHELQVDLYDMFGYHSRRVKTEDGIAPKKQNAGPCEECPSADGSASLCIM